MKKLIFAFAFLLICSSAFAVDTNLGKLNLTEKQFSQSESLKNDVIRGFSYWGGGMITVVSTRDLTSGEKSELISNMESLPDEYTQAHYISAFDVVMFQQDLADALIGDQLSSDSLRLEFAALNAYAINKDFDGMYSYLGWLISKGIATEKDVTVVVAILANQGVVIGD